MNNLLKKLVRTYFIVENQTQTHFSKDIFSMIFINFSKNFSKFFHRFLKNPLGSENFEKFFIIFKNRKKFFDKNGNYFLDDAASEKSIKNRFSNIYGVRMTPLISPKNRYLPVESIIRLNSN